MGSRLYGWKPGSDRVLHPGQDEGSERQNQQQNQDRRSDPNSKTPIIRIIDRAMCLIEMDHANAVDDQY
jgi:hypothetical protein